MNMDRAFINGLLQQLNDNIAKTENDVLTPIKKINNCMEYCRQAELLLKDHILKKGFNELSDEIEFFKYIKPSFVSNGIYYAKLHSIETSRLPVSKKMTIAFFKEQHKKIDHFAINNSNIWQYYNSGDVVHDHVYFTRVNNQHVLPFRISIHDIDHRYTSLYSCIISKFLANKKIEVYVQDKLDALNGFSKRSDTLCEKLQWNSSKADLVELIYGLSVANVIQDDIKKTTKVIGDLFNVNISEPYKIWGDIKSRKKEKTKFLNSLIKLLEQRIEQDFD